MDFFFDIVDEVFLAEEPRHVQWCVFGVFNSTNTPIDGPPWTTMQGCLENNDIEYVVTYGYRLDSDADDYLSGHYVYRISIPDMDHALIFKIQCG